MKLSQRDRFLYWAGQATEEIRRAALEELNDPHSELSRAIEELRHEALEGGPTVDLTFAYQTIAVAERDLNSRHHRRSWLKSTAIVLTACLLLSATTYTGWAMWSRPLLEDSFHNGWFNSQLWQPPPPQIREGGVRAEEGFLRLVNRGYLRPRQEIPVAFELECDWKWIQLGLNPQYAEHLSVAIRSQGNPAQKRPYEAVDGIIIKFNAWGGYINIATIDGQELARTPSASVPLPADQWHRVRIVDDGKRISIFVSGPAITDRDPKQAILECRHETPEPGSRFSIYNRELVGFPHESCIRNLQVRAIEKE